VIYYRPTDGDPYPASLVLRPRTCFLITQLGQPLPDSLPEIHDIIRATCAKKRFQVRDATALVTGKDFLLKIWSLALSVPVGIAVIHEAMRSKTIANIFYELGLMQAYGKETVVVKTPEASVPSDLVRTEYLVCDEGVGAKLERFLDSVDERADYFVMMSELLENNPLLSIDYLRRAFLISGSEGHREAVETIRDGAGFEGRAKNSVEMLATQFLLANE